MSDDAGTPVEATTTDANSGLASQGEPTTVELPTNISSAREGPEGTNDHGQQLREILRALEESTRISTERERVIDRLYEENQRLRAGELQQAVMPILRDLMRLFDDLQKTAAAYSDRASLDP